MKKKEIHNAIKVMQAYLDGKIIESKRSNENDWREVKNPAWNFNDVNYRVKPTTMKLSEELSENVGLPYHKLLEGIKELEALCKEQEMIIKVQRNMILSMKCCENCKNQYLPQSCVGCDDTLSKWKLKE